MASELDAKIQDVYRRIQTEQKMLDASRLLRQATTNPDVLRKTDTKIREAQQSLSYFQETLRELQARKRSVGTSIQNSPQRPNTSPTSQTSHPWLSSADRERALPAPPPTSDYDFDRLQDLDPSRSQTAPFSDGAPRQKQYSNLDLIKADTPHTTAKISRMLHQLEFKLQVELKYKEGIDKMVRLYQAEGDKKSRMDAESKRVESDKKIQLLQSALKRYKSLHILDDVDEEEETAPGDGVERKDNLRKPLSGKLQITVKQARDLDHVPLIKRSAKAANDTTVHIKIEGTPRARTHPSRTDRWNESFEIAVDKANEVEIAVHDKQVGEQPTPIGLLWIRISDLVEALRRQKIEQEAGQGGWVTAAGAMGAQPSFNGTGAGQAPFGQDATYAPLAPQFTPGGPVPGAAGPSSLGQPEGIDAWFAVEPVGAIQLHVNFIKENVRKRPIDAGLGRQGAVRKKKDEVHEMNGHKFVQRQFYQIMLCAFCNEFLLNAAGYQCEDCRYTCHKKCYEKVVTKCISKSNADLPSDEEKINHRIPHRFDTITNLSANWCCHCGYMLPLGRRNAKKCTECNITCHATCAHLVPDFCGMSNERANYLLAQIRDIKDLKTRQKSPTTAYKQPTMSPIAGLPIGGYQDIQQPQTLESQLGGMRIDEDPFAPPPPPVQTNIPPQQQQPYSYTTSPTSQTSAPRFSTDQQPPPARSWFDQPPAAPPGAEAYRQYPQQQVPAGYPQAPVSPPRQPMQPAVPAPPPAAVPAPAPVIAQHRPPPPDSVAVAAARSKRKVGLDDFNFLAVLGKGNFGKVMLAEEKTTSRLWAIKVLKKEFIIDNDEVESTRSEKRVFMAAARERHPFLLDLHSCFQTETRVYFVMEYVSGGDLMLHIQRKQFSLRQAKFYASEVLLALQYFHANGIIYRDLKLDNILLTLDGHVKVADYGLCKEEMWWGQTTSTFCGTPEFMAPEILLEQRYGLAVDWWAFGVLMYEMLLGQSPFRGDDEDEIFDAILEDEPLYPITMPRDAVSILQKLLTRDPTRRLGSGQADAEEIKRHPFFKDVSFDDILQKRIPPPYFPTITSASDTSNFDSEFTREQPTLTPVHGQLSARDQAEFEGFSWVATWADSQQ